jgi:hypothetical protein
MGGGGDSMASPDLTRVNFFLGGGHLKKHVHAVFLRAIEDLVARLHTPVTTVDANTLRRVRENAAQRTALLLHVRRRPFHGNVYLEN